VVEELDPPRPLATADAGDGQVVLVGGVLGQEGVDLFRAETAAIVRTGDGHIQFVAQKVRCEQPNIHSDAQVDIGRLLVLTDQEGVDGIGQQFLEHDVAVRADLGVLQASADIQCHRYSVGNPRVPGRLLRAATRPSQG